MNVRAQGGARSGDDDRSVRTQERRYRVRRSDGTHEFLTRSELDELNHRRKVRDQRRQDEARRREHLGLLLGAIPTGVTLIVLVMAFADPGSDPLEGTPPAPSPSPVAARPAASSTDIVDTPARALRPVPVVRDETPTPERDATASPVRDRGAATAPPTVATAPGSARPVPRRPDGGPAEPVVEAEVDAVPPEGDPPVTVASTETAAGASAAVEAAVRSWLSHWRNRDAQGYVGSYATDYAAPGRTREAWVRARTERLARVDTIEVRAEALAVELLGADRARVEFVQTYRDALYADRSVKVLELTRAPTGWTIVSETSRVIAR